MIHICRLSGKTKFQSSQNLCNNYFSANLYPLFFSDFCNISYELVHIIYVHVQQKYDSVTKVIDIKNGYGFLGSLSLNVKRFKGLLHQFNKHFKYKFGTEKGGRPARLPSTHSVLAMVLTFYTDPISHKRCCELFGIPRSTQSSIFRGLGLGFALARLGVATGFAD
ncbi:hypothetical protein BC833DRAFT_640195 [Globomyces pollinis-pini]|nr:hypothetical protein BC833DRAFT_640195 [Globomyces pollinis-pini]